MATTAPRFGEQLSIEIPDGARKLEVSYVLHETVHPDPTQPRVDADDELRASIATSGILQPITVRPHPERRGEYMIVDGERRWRGSAGVQLAIPVLVRRDQADDYERLRTQLVANTGKALAPIEEARAFARMLEVRRCTVERLAKDLGRARTTVGERLALLELGPWVPLIADGSVPVSYAVRALLPIRNAPDAVHAEAFARAQARGDVADDYDGFLRMIRYAYLPAAYPLVESKASWQPQPQFSTKKHDKECGCGAPEWDFGHGDPRRACLNPAWWKPQDEAGRAAKEKADAKAAAKQRHVAPPSRVIVPEGVESVRGDWHRAPEGVHFLTDEDGRWKCGYFDDDDCFDPSTFPRDEAQLVAVETPHGVRIGTRDGELVEQARTAWHERWTERAAALVEDFRAAVNAAPAITGPGVGALILAVIQRTEDLYWLDEITRMVGIRGREETEDDVGDDAEYSDVAAYLESLTQAERELIARAMAHGGSDRRDPARVIREEKRRAVDEIERHPSPWAIDQTVLADDDEEEIPRGGLAPALEAMDDEDEADEPAGVGAGWEDDEDEESGDPLWDSEGGDD